jgi:hypothetical protein
MALVRQASTSLSAYDGLPKTLVLSSFAHSLSYFLVDALLWISQKCHFFGSHTAKPASSACLFVLLIMDYDLWADWGKEFEGKISIDKKLPRLSSNSVLILLFLLAATINMGRAFFVLHYLMRKKSLNNLLETI